MSIADTPLKTVILATGNPGKVKEMQALLATAGYQIQPQSDFEVPAAAETGLTFVENALLKARNACEHTGLPAIADDSGLEVDALGGQPGIYSARFAGADASDADNNQKLLNSLQGLTQDERRARFRCALVYMRHAQDPAPIICEGAWEGRILHSPDGDGGFGYDPLFWVDERQCSAASLSKADKNAISHRGQAMQQLLARLQARPGRA